MRNDFKAGGARPFYGPTGRARVRVGWFGRLVLQVEVRVAYSFRGVSTLIWRDAELTNLASVQPVTVLVLDGGVSATISAA